MLYLLVALGIGLLISSVTKSQFVASQIALLGHFFAGDDALGVPVRFAEHARRGAGDNLCVAGPLFRCPLANRLPVGRHLARYRAKRRRAGGRGGFAAAVRRLQDLTVSTRPDEAAWAAAAEHVLKACALLDGHQVPETEAVAGRVLSLPGLGHPLLPPWTMTDAGADGVAMDGHFTQSHVGGNHAVHGGMIPLFYDWLFGMVVAPRKFGRPAPPTSMSTTAASPRSTSR